MRIFDHIKKKGIMLRGNNSGVIIFIVLWILVILTSLVMSLSRNTHVELALTKNTIGKIQAKYFAWAGLMFAMKQIQLDSKDQNSSLKDTLFYCGIPIVDGRSSAEIFHDHKISDGAFDVFYESRTDGQLKVRYGIQDEERFINLNALGLDSVNVLSSLLTTLGVDDDTAKTIAFSAIDWKDDDAVLSDEKYGAEDDYYQGLTRSYKTKNYFFESKEELLYVRGMTKEILEKIKPFITVFGLPEQLKINFETASEDVLRALARAEVIRNPTVDSADADSLIRKMLEYRSGDDRVEFTEDDKEIERVEDLNPNANEQVIFLAMNQYRIRQSEFLRIHAKGIAGRDKIESHIEAVVQRVDSSILYWNRY